MAQYYVRSQRSQHPPSIIADSVPDVEERPLSALQLGDSIYIFPNPSSAPPSPSQASDFSAPTDFNFSGPSEPPRSREGSVQRSSIRRYSSASLPRSSWSVHPLSPRIDGDEQWEWADSMDESVFAFEDETERPDRWEVLVRRRARDSQLDYHRSGSSPHITLNSHRRVQSNGSNRTASPHPRIQIPLLSFFISLFSINDTTLHLLSHSSSHSVLFPGHTLPTDTTSADAGAWQPHGVAKLLGPSSETRILKDGCAVASDPSFAPSNPFLISPFRLVGLLGFVSDFVANGGKALREILHD